LTTSGHISVRAGCSGRYEVTVWAYGGDPARRTGDLDEIVGTISSHLPDRDLLPSELDDDGAGDDGYRADRARAATWPEAGRITGRSDVQRT
jgi:hypothetical protein